MSMHDVGFDIGFGNIKLYDSKGSTVFASHVAVWNRQYSEDSINGGGDTADSGAVCVEFGGRKFYTGLNADRHGRTIGNLGFNRIQGSLEARALLYGALTRHFSDHGKTRKPLRLWAALPVDMLDEDAEDTSADVREWLIGIHEWVGDGDSYKVEVAAVEIKSQPAGALFDFIYDDSGNTINENMALLKKEIGIISVGFNTVEMLVMRGAKPDHGMTSGEQNGVRRLLEIIRGENDYELSTLDAYLRAGSIEDEVREAMVPWVEMVQANIERNWGSSWKRFGRIIVVGGGAALMNGHLTKYFRGKTHMPDLPIESIARGMYKRSLADARKAK